MALRLSISSRVRCSNCWLTKGVLQCYDCRPCGRQQKFIHVFGHHQLVDAAAGVGGEFDVLAGA
jgi:hypothetical protein